VNRSLSRGGWARRERNHALTNQARIDYDANGEPFCVLDGCSVHAGGTKPCPLPVANHLPPYTDDPADRLRHTVAAFRDLPDTQMAILATFGAVLGHPVTGLTWGDLRAIANRLAS
jgi:hypothetical protein